MIATSHPHYTHGNVEFDLKVVGLGPTPQCEAVVQAKGYTAWSDQGLTNVLQNLGSIKTVIYDCFYNEMTTSNLIIKPRDYGIITHLQ